MLFKFYVFFIVLVDGVLDFVFIMCVMKEVIVFFVLMILSYIVEY